MPALVHRLRRFHGRMHVKYLQDFVFIHINKTGGSSIEAALGIPFQHRTAAEVIEDIGVDRWSRRFTFAFVRNPWDKVASHYRYRVRTDQTGLASAGIGFEEWVHLAYGERDPRFYDKPRMFMPQVDWISDASGRVAVDFVGRFESLRDDFQRVCRALGRRADLPHLKRSNRGDYRELYGRDSAEVVARRFAPDLDAFGYTFDESRTGGRRGRPRPAAPAPDRR